MFVLSCFTVAFVPRLLGLHDPQSFYLGLAVAALVNCLRCFMLENTLA